MAREHGTVSRYKAGCRCPECAEANTEYQREYKRRRRTGRPTTNLVDAAPVRAHVRALMAAGMTRQEIAARANATDPLRHLLYGKPSQGYPPARRINAITARRILAIPVPDGPVASWGRVDGDGPRRRVQALAAIGWPMAWQAEQVGMHPKMLQRFVRGRSRISAVYAARIRDLYDRYWDRGPEPSRYVSVARTVARRNGWLPPMAWDDDLIDLPEPDLEAELQRRVTRMTQAELARCYRAHRAGDQSPLIVAAATVYRRRKSLLAAA